MADEALAVFHEPAASRRSNRRRALVVCLAAIVALACVAVAGQVATPAAMQTDFAQKNLAPCAAHPFGTDWMGRDMLMRTLAGLSTSVLIGCVAALASSLIAPRVGGDGGAWRTEGRCGDHLVGGFGHGRSPHRFAHSHLLRIGQRVLGRDDRRGADALALAHARGARGGSAVQESGFVAAARARRQRVRDRGQTHASPTCFPSSSSDWC